MRFVRLKRNDGDVVAGKTRAAPSYAPGALRIGDPNDAYEQEAERVADEVMSGGGASRHWQISNVGLGNVQRQPSGQQPAPKPNNYDEAAKKLGEAFLQTDVGKKLTNAVSHDPLVKGAEDFVGTLPGKIIAGAAAVGAVSALAAGHQPLPVKIPKIPLDKIRPGLSVKITYEGPVDHPTNASITFSYTPKREQKKPKETASEKYRSETARIAADQDKFRKGMTYKEGSAQDLQQKAEQKAIEDYTLHRFGALPGTGDQPLVKTYPALQGQRDIGLHMPTFELPFQPKPFHVLDQQLELKPLTSSNTPSEKEKKEETAPVQRQAEHGAPRLGGTPAPEIVQDVLNSPGQPLDNSTLDFFEPRFRRDLSGIRIHQGHREAEAARAVNAKAYTVGEHIVLGDSASHPGSQVGRRLLAHELTHTVQQSASGSQARSPTKSIGKTAGAQNLQRQTGGGLKLATPDANAFAAADPEAAALLRAVIVSAGRSGIPTGKSLPAGTLPAGGGISLTFAIDPTLNAAGLTHTTSVSSPNTRTGSIALAMIFKSSSPTQQTWFHEFQHVLIEISKARVQAAGSGTATGSNAANTAVRTAMASSRTATRYWADLTKANLLPESQSVIRDYKTIAGAATTAAAGARINILNNSDVIEHVVNERRAKLEEQAFVVANRRGNPSTAGLPAFMYDELIVPIRGQLTVQQQAMFDASVNRLQLRGNLEASLTQMFAKL